MTAFLHRASPADLEVRGDGRTVVGIAVPFDAPTQIRELGRSYTEIFRNGAFARTIAERGPQKVKVLVNHDNKALPIGRASVLREDAAGLYAELRVSNTPAGDNVLELVRDGALDGLSISFEPMRDGTATRGVVERLEVRLREISVVGFPAYEGAQIAAVRDAIPSLSLITVDAARRRLALLDRR